MSHIDDLMRAHCPNGVRYRPLGDACKIETGKRDANEAVEGAEYLFFTTSRETSTIDEFRWDTEALLIAGNANVGDVKHYVGKFDAYQRTYVLSDFNQDLMPRFLFYSIKSGLKNYLSDKTNAAAMTYIVLGTLKNFPIPVPPIEVQQEIVDILDKFTQLEAELEAELEARRKQYEHYHQTLIWGHASKKGSRWCTVKDICIDKFWLMPATPKYIDDGEIPYITSKNLQDGEISFEKAKLISHESFMEISKNRSIQGGDILIGMIGTIGEVAIVKPNEPRFYGQNMYLLRLNLEEIDVDYFLQFLNSSEVRNRFSAVKHNSSQGYLKAEHVENLRLPLPSLLEQRRIASMLDSFKAMTKSVCVGLPAEIDARRKQYEYYRDRLLTFKEFDAA